LAALGQHAIRTGEAAECFREAAEAFAAQAAELLLQELLNLRSGLLQAATSLVGDAGSYDPPVSRRFAARNQAACLQPLQKAGDIGAPRVHARADLGTGAALGRGVAQNTQYAVLLQSQIKRFQRRAELVCEMLGGDEEPRGGLLLAGWLVGGRHSANCYNKWRCLL